MSRILGIDHGTRRVGLALSDPMGWTAQPFQTLEMRGERALFASLLEIVKTHEVERIVVGLPLGLDGEEGPQAIKVRAFGVALQKFLAERELPGMSVVFIDERLTTVLAERVLEEADLSRRRRREVIDKQAAAVMLQTYLDTQCSTIERTID